MRAQRHEPRALPPRRVPGRLLIGAVVVAAVIVMMSVGRSTGSVLTAAISAALVVLGIAVVYVPVNLTSFGRARARLNAIEESLPGDGEAISIRCTVLPGGGFPFEPRSLLEDYASPWKGYNVLVFGDRGLEIRQLRSPGSSAGILIYYASIRHVEAKLAPFGNYSERAIFVSGEQGGHHFRLGLAPIEKRALLLTPVGDEAFRSILAQTITRAVA